MIYPIQLEKRSKRHTIPDDVRQALYRRIGYPLPNADGETHVYDPAFTDMASARNEMNTITMKVFTKIFGEHEQLPDEHAALHVDVDDDDDDVILE